MHEREIPAGDGPEVAMPRYGITDIADFAEKIRFSLLLLSPRVLVEKIRDAGGQLTVTTLNAWRAGQNLPSYPKLRQFCRAANIEPVDFHLELDAFMRRICDANGISEEERRIHAARFRSFLYSGLRFRAVRAAAGGISGVQSCPQQPRRGACVADTLRESGTSVCHDALLFHAGRILH